jgi:dTDP-glucose 4,6-dehydratase
MNLLVTGGAGFIGTNYIHYMLEKDPEVNIVCLDSLTYAGNINNLDHDQQDSRFRFVRADITKAEQVSKLFGRIQFDAVVNFAAESHVDRSIEDPGIFIKCNIEGVQVLMDECRRTGVKRFHQVSTDEVYGELPLDRPDLLFKEDNPLRTSSPYAASKAGADLLVLAYHRTFGMDVTISRCSNNYGPYQFPEKLIPKMILLASQGLPLPVYGKGENVRDWLHAFDHCQAIDLIVNKGKAGQVYNVGGNNERKNIDIVNLILRQMGKDEDLIRFVKDRPGHDLRYAIDASKIRSELGWKPRYDFDAGLEETINWYISNMKWLKDIENGSYLKANESVR